MATQVQENGKQPHLLLGGAACVNEVERNLGATIGCSMSPDHIENKI